jgi:outer membrane biogenesis lipoprotein LolB
LSAGRLRGRWWLSGLTLAGLVTACAQAPLAPPASSTQARATTAGAIELQGQMGIKLGAWQAEPARGMSFGFFFQGEVERGSLSLMTPLGSQVAQVEWTPDHATLRRIGPGGGEDIRPTTRLQRPAPSNNAAG